MDELETRVKELEGKKQVLTDKVPCTLLIIYYFQRTELEDKIKAMEKRFKERKDVAE